jgi:hypothetical protein
LVAKEQHAGTTSGAGTGLSSKFLLHLECYLLSSKRHIRISEWIKQTKRHISITKKSDTSISDLSRYVSDCTVHEKFEDIKGVHNQKPLRTDNTMVKRRTDNTMVNSNTPVPLVEQELVNIPKHLFFCAVCVAQSLVFSVVFCRSLCVLLSLL